VLAHRGDGHHQVELDSGWNDASVGDVDTWVAVHLAAHAHDALLGRLGQVAAAEGMANDRNLLFGSRRESLKPGSISRLRASCQQLDSESDKETS
jgi:hypothetical protein